MDSLPNRMETRKNITKKSMSRGIMNKIIKVINVYSEPDVKDIARQEPIRSMDKRKKTKTAKRS